MSGRGDVLEGVAYGGGGAFWDEALVAKEAVDGRRWGAVGPVEETSAKQESADGPGISSLEVAGGIPTAVVLLRAYDQAKQPAEVPGGRSRDLSGHTAGAEGAFAQAGVVAPERECSGIGRAGDIVDDQARPARVGVHGGVAGCVVDDSQFVIVWDAWP